MWGTSGPSTRGALRGIQRWGRVVPDSADTKRLSSLRTPTVSEPLRRHLPHTAAETECFPSVARGWRERSRLPPRQFCGPEAPESHGTLGTRPRAISGSAGGAVSGSAGGENKLGGLKAEVPVPLLAG